MLEAVPTHPTVNGLVQVVVIGGLFDRVIVMVVVVRVTVVKVVVVLVVMVVRGS